MNSHITHTFTFQYLRVYDFKWVLKKHQLKDISHSLHQFFVHCALIYDCSNDQLDWILMRIICTFLLCFIVRCWEYESLNGQLDWMKSHVTYIEIDQIDFCPLFHQIINYWDGQIICMNRHVLCILMQRRPPGERALETPWRPVDQAQDCHPLRTQPQRDQAQGLFEADDCRPPVLPTAPRKT